MCIAHRHTNRTDIHTLFKELKRMFEHETHYFYANLKNKLVRVRERPELNIPEEALELESELCDLGPWYETYLKAKSREGSRTAEYAGGSIWDS